MDLQTRNITPDEFREFTGIDLTQELPEQDAKAFLNRIEVRMSAYLDAQYFQNIDAKYPNFTDYQKRCYKYALIEQALYVFKNGDISVDSGYDPEGGVIATRDTIKQLALSPNAEMQLINCGLLTRKINARQNIGFKFFW